MFISGTTAHDDAGTLQGGQDAYAQAAYILRKIALAAFGQVRASLPRCGAHPRIRGRLDDWRDVARAPRRRIRPHTAPNTLVQVAGLVDGPLVEIEADAVIPALMRFSVRFNNDLAVSA